MKIITLITLSILLNSCTSLFYQPDRYLYRHPDQVNVLFQELWFKSENQVELNAWYLKNSQKLKSPKGLVIFFHGNAQNISAHFLILAWLTKHGYDVLIADYRGYGQSEGDPTPSGVYKDSLAILKKARELYKRDKHKKIIVYGQSLGGAIAARAYQDFKFKEEIDLLVLDSTFMSYKSVAWSVATGNYITFLFSPFAWLLVSDKYSPEKYIPKIQTPTLVIHSKSDAVISFDHGEQIFNKLTSKKKWFWQLDNVRHIGVFSDKGKIQRAKFLKLLEKI